MEPNVSTKRYCNCCFKLKFYTFCTSSNVIIVVLVATSLNIDLQDQSEITQVHVIIPRIVLVIILVAIVTMDLRRVNVTTLHITLRHETLLPVIATTRHLVPGTTHLVAATTSSHELIMTSIWLLVAMDPGTQIFW